MSQKRDSGYYLARLRKDHPVVFADYKAGKYGSVRNAAIAAGLVSERGHLGGLKRHWKKATAAEKKAFTAWVVQNAPVKKPPPIVDPSGRVSVAAANFLYGWTKANRLAPGRIMQILGFSRYDYRLAEAMRRSRPINAEIVPPLAVWMQKHGFK